MSTPVGMSLSRRVILLRSTPPSLFLHSILHDLRSTSIQAANRPSMTFSNWAEQLITHRPASYVPGHTTGNLFNLSRDRHPDILNQVHHYGMAILNAPIRAIMSYYGIIGPFASFMFTGIRIVSDQLAENTAGTSALPWTWPINEQ